MKLLKSAGIVLVAILMVSIYLWNSYVDLIDPYRWDDPVREEAKANGYQLLQLHRGGDMFPWTWFYRYTTHLAFVKPDTIKPFRQFIAAEVAWLRREDRGRIERSRTLSLFDCKEKAFATLADESRSYEDRLFRPDGGPMLMWWTEMNVQMTSYFCKP